MGLALKSYPASGITQYPSRTQPSFVQCIQGHAQWQPRYMNDILHFAIAVDHAFQLTLKRRRYDSRG